MYTRTNWADRVTEHPNGYTIIKADGTTEDVTLTRNNGQVAEEGTPLDAAHLNNIEEGLQETASQIATLSGQIISLSDLRTDIDAVQQETAEAGAHAMSNEQRIEQLEENTAEHADELSNIQAQIDSCVKNSGTTGEVNVGSANITESGFNVNIAGNDELTVASGNVQVMNALQLGRFKLTISDGKLVIGVVA